MTNKDPTILQKTNDNLFSIKINLDIAGKSCNLFLDHKFQPLLCLFSPVTMIDLFSGSRFAVLRADVNPDKFQYLDKRSKKVIKQYRNRKVNAHQVYNLVTSNSKFLEIFAWSSLQLVEQLEVRTGCILNVFRFKKNSCLEIMEYTISTKWDEEVHFEGHKEHFYLEALAKI